MGLWFENVHYRLNVRMGMSAKVKFCGVCGNVARSRNFGVLCCESCKSFFRRSVLNKKFGNFRCVGNGDRPCLISSAKRSRCRSCRMNRCLAIGMGKDNLLPSNHTALLQVSSIRDSVNSHQSVDGISRTATILTITYEFREIQDAIAKHHEACIEIPYRTINLVTLGQPNIWVKKVIATLIRRFTVFAGLLPDFSNLPFKDQNILLKSGVVEMCILHGVLGFDPSTNCWYEVPSANKDTALPILNLEDLKHLTAPPLVHQRHPQFMTSIQSLSVDEPIVMFLILIVLFDPERDGLSRSGWIGKIQLKYVLLLERYLNRLYSTDGRRNILFGKLLTKLSDLRELGEYYLNFAINKSSI